jgi:hypothetical protein
MKVAILKRNAHWISLVSSDNYELSSECAQKFLRRKHHLLRNVSIRLQEYTGVINYKITIFVTTAVETSEPISGF